MSEYFDEGDLVRTPAEAAMEEKRRQDQLAHLERGQTYSTVQSQELHTPETEDGSCRHGMYLRCEICAEADPLIAERDALKERVKELEEALP